MLPVVFVFGHMPLPISSSHLSRPLSPPSGAERKSRIPDEETNLNTAYHEGGHTLVAHFTKHADPVHKVTIMPRSRSLGHVSVVWWGGGGAGRQGDVRQLGIRE